MNLKIFAETVEPEALNQIYTLAKHPSFTDAKIRIMPDCHAGTGCVIGFTADLGDKVVPNLVGVDIGCGMLTVKLSDADIDLSKLDTLIRKEIPSGRNVRSINAASFDYEQLFCANHLNTAIINPSIGTLGGGNHFIEVDRSDNGLYLIIHTGSRNLGKQVADHYQKLAMERLSGRNDLQKLIDLKIAKLKALHREKDIEKEIARAREDYIPLMTELKIPKDLAYLEGNDRYDYIHDMRLCQEYAKLNRKVIADIIIRIAGLHETDRFETVHNYIGDDNIIRKGAISAYTGQKVLIPLNMRDGCIIGVGKGNVDWNNSAPHGAGRLMSRSKAKEILNVDDFQKSMEGIYTTSANSSTIDEAPAAYKPAEEIISLVGDAIDIIEVIKPIYNFKDFVPSFC